MEMVVDRPMMMEFKRHVKKVGSSLMIPMTDGLRKIGLGANDPVIILVDEKNKQLIVKKDVSSLPNGLDQSFFDAYEKSIAKHDRIFKTLKDM